MKIPGKPCTDTTSCPCRLRSHPTPWGFLRGSAWLLPLLMLMAILGDISAATAGKVVVDLPCVTVTCPDDYTIFTCSDTATPAAYNIDIQQKCAGAAIPVEVRCNPAPGTPLGVGVHPVSCVFFVNRVAVGQCSFNITVIRDTGAPKIECPTAPVIMTIPCTSNCVPVKYPLPAVLNGALESCTPALGTCLPVGTNVITCVATNVCGDMARCQFNVIVKSRPAVEIRCPDDVVLKTCGDCVKYEYPRPAVANGAIAFCDPAPGFCFPVGVTVVTCVATNECGKTQCKFTVTVRKEAQPPQIRCPDNIVVETCDPDCAKVVYPAPVVVNGSLASCTPPSGSCFPIGTTVVHCIATNNCERTECRFTVTVRRKQPPVIKCPDDLVLETCGPCATLAFPAPVALNGALASCSPAPGTCLPIGTHIVSCIATNDCGRSECKFTVTVRRQRPIDIDCPRDIVIRTCGDGEFVAYPRPRVVGSDDATAYDMTCLPAPGSYFPVGTNKVVCCVFDRCAQRRICCEFNIIVVKGEPCVKPPSNMVLWLPLDEPAGVWANNAIGGAPNGLHIGGPVPILGQKVLNSLGFDGANDHVAVPNYAAIVMNTNDFSIDAWILRREEGGRRVIVSKVGPPPAGAASPVGYEFYLNNGVMNLWLGGTTVSNYNSGVVVPNDNQWHHVAVTLRRSSFGAVRFFLDGTQVSAHGGTVVAPLGNGSRLNVGASTYPLVRDHFRGGIDEVEIFDRQLSPVEVFALWKADRAGKCKIKCSMPWDVPYPQDGGPALAHVTLCNCSGVDQYVTWVPGGPMPLSGSGTLLLPAGACSNIVVRLGRPTNNVPVGTQVAWTLTLFPTFGCPTVCSGTVINPGPVSATTPEGVVNIPGVGRPVNIPVGVDGLPPGEPLRIRAIGPDMQPDLEYVSLNGLPPGTPWVIAPRIVGLALDEFTVNLPVSFARGNPIGNYTILIEADLDGDGEYNTLRSFDLNNTVVPPPTLAIQATAAGDAIVWTADASAVLESSSSLDGPWTPIPGATSGYLLKPTEKHLFFRVTVPTE